MFGNIGWAEMLILLVAALVILGPERLPGAIQWVTKAIGQVRDYASGATSQLKSEFGEDFEDLRQPLSELNKIRAMNPRAMITKHLLDGDDSLLTGRFEKPITPASSDFGNTNMKPLAPGEVPPLDPDAT